MSFSPRHHRALPALVITSFVCRRRQRRGGERHDSPPGGTAPRGSAAAGRPRADLAAAAADLREIGFDQIADSVDAASEGDVG